MLNRAVARAQIFDKPLDSAAFEKVLPQAKAEGPRRRLADSVLPNPCHLLLWPYADGDRSAFLHWLTRTHTQRWPAPHHPARTGPLYPGRFKSLPVPEDEHLLAVCRYGERNPLPAHLVPQADTWRWCSRWHRVKGSAERLLDAWPVASPPNWLEQVQEPPSEAALAARRRGGLRGSPEAAAPWQVATAAQLGLQATLRARGRPRVLPPGQG